jgi:DNA-binding NtrC family response regulator
MLDAERATLLSIIELGGYPNFTPLYEQAGYRVTIERSMRKALAFLKKSRPAVIVAEFNFQSDFRDRTSSLESLLAVVQRLAEVKVIVFYDQQQAHQLAKLQTRFPAIDAMPYPIEPGRLAARLARSVAT